MTISDPDIQIGTNADRSTTVRISGDVTAATGPAVRSMLDGAAGSGPLIVDLNGVTDLDAAGLDLLKDVAGERGLEVVIGPDCPVFSVVQVSGLCEEALVQCR
jgi:anti-anti-sigma regulatory factor